MGGTASFGLDNLNLHRAPLRCNERLIQWLLCHDITGIYDVTSLALGYSKQKNSFAVGSNFK